jgi:hypothetical protein
MLGNAEVSEKRAFPNEHEDEPTAWEDKSASSVESLGEGGRTINHPYAHNLGKK